MKILLEDIKDLLDSILENEYQRKRAILLVQNANVPQALQDQLIAVITKKGEHSPMTKLSDALKVDGVSDYIQSKIDEAVSISKDELNAVKAELETVKNANAELSTKLADASAAAANDNAPEVGKDIFIDHILDMSIALRTKEIDMQAVKTSSDIYRAKLQDMNVADLKTLRESLQTEMATTFHKVPAETVVTDGQVIDPSVQDKKQTQPITDMTSLISALVDSEQKKS